MPKLTEYEVQDVKRLIDEFNVGFYDSLHVEITDLVERIGEIYDKARARDASRVFVL